MASKRKHGDGRKELHSILIICLQSVKWLQVLLFNTNYSIQHYSFICTFLNCSKYFYVIPILQFQHAVKEFQVLLLSTNNSIQHYSFICTQLNGSKYCYILLTIQLKISHSCINDQAVLFQSIQFKIECNCRITG